MTRSVTRALTGTDVLILSPVYPPARPENEPAFFDDFERCVKIFESGRMYWTQEGGRVCLAARAHLRAGDPLYAVTVILRDGRTDPTILPGGRVDREMVAQFVSVPIEIYGRPPDWGVRTKGFQLGPNGSFSADIPVPVPLIDPIRDGARLDDDTVFPICFGFPDPWRGVLTAWEELDGALGRADPNEAWLRRRQVTTLELQGWHEEEHTSRYEGMWREPRQITAYLGWPAYLLDVASPQGTCDECGGATVPGRRFCVDPACRRVRAAARQRSSRAGRNRGQ